MSRRALAFCVLPLLLALLVLLALPALGQNETDEAVCADRAARLPADEVMAACNRLTADTHQRDSARARAFVWRAAANLRARQSEAAMADVNQAVVLDGDNFDARFLRAQLRVAAKDYQAALDDYGAAEKLDPRNAALHLQRSQLYLNLQRYPEAIADADFGYGGGAAVLNQRCWIRVVAGVELDKARLACDQALWAAPDNPSILDSAGVLGLKQKRFQAAWNDFDAIARQQPRSARALYGRGLAAIGLGRDDDAKADIARAEALNRDVAAAFRQLGLPPA